MIQQAVILAGGEGTRLRPVTLEIPKPLIPVQGKPIITWQAEWLARGGVSSIIVIVRPRWKKHFEEWKEERKEQMPNLSIELWEEVEPMGTLGAIAGPLRERFQAPFIVTNGDELKGLDLAALEAFHKGETEALATIALVQVANPSEYGVAELEGTFIKRFHEKPAVPPSNLISSGLYVIEPRALDLVAKGSLFLMFEKDLFPMLAQRKELGGCPLNGHWFDCGTLERWERAIREWPGA